MRRLALTFFLAFVGGCGPLPGAGGDSADGSVEDDAGPTACDDDSDCGGGICVDGVCCPSFDRVCGDSCCGTSEICFANACVTPGDVCRTAGDCDEDQYCETGLGDDPGDVPQPDAGADCIHAPPPEGRCLDLPPDCPPGVPPPTDGSCLPACEYHPPAGPLQAKVKWQWGPTAGEFAEFTDVWATPAVARLYDSNCDGAVNELDPPSVVFVAGNARGTCCSCGGYTPSTCQTGVLRVLDGQTGAEIWSLRKADPASIGFAGLAVALGDLDGAGGIDIAAVTGEGKIAVVSAEGAVLRVSDLPIPGSGANGFGWGGGLAVADMNHDGAVDIAYGSTLFTTAGGGLTRLFSGATAGNRDISIFADVDGGGDLELVTGTAAYRYDGSALWTRADLPDVFPAVGDFDADGASEVVVVGGGKVWLLAGATGATLLGPLTLPGTGSGGPPTVADFDGDGAPEIGVAQATYYSVVEADLGGGGLALLWQTANHDLSSSVTGSTVFDFEGDGKAEVVYNDECFLWVYDGTTGAVRFATPTTSFTATEASVVADVDGDGHAEMVMISNGADPSAAGWGCNVAPWNQPDPGGIRPAWAPPPGAGAYRGITVLGDVANAWVGTRTLWNQHSYHVTNVCDDRDGACPAPNLYGSIPRFETPNVSLPWLNNFRQNVQDEGIFNAPDPTVRLKVDCAEPVVLHAYVQNLGQAFLPAGVTVGFFVRRGGVDTLLGTALTPVGLFPGQVAPVDYTAEPADAVTLDDEFVAAIVVDPANPTFRECREDNNASPPAVAVCVE